jgi:hypothetical protein
MTQTHWTGGDYRVQLSPALNERVYGARVIWLIGRLIIGCLFLVSGTQKLMALDKFLHWCSMLVTLPKCSRLSERYRKRWVVC